MQTRPFLQRLFPFLKKKSKLEQPNYGKTHDTFPLSPPTPNEKAVVRVRRSRRIKIPWNPPVSDSRFNHALRPSHIARAEGRKLIIVDSGREG